MPAKFRQQFYETCAGTSKAPVQSTAETTTIPTHLPIPPQSRSHGIFKMYKESCGDHPPTSGAFLEPWTLDPNSYAFSLPFRAPAGYSTPFLCGQDTMFQPELGGLYSPMLAPIAISTPPSTSGSGEPVNAGADKMDLCGFEALQSDQKHQFNPLIQPLLSSQQEYPSFLPDLEDRTYEMMRSDRAGPEARPPEKTMKTDAQQYGKRIAMMQALPSNADTLRFHCTLNAPTAMIEHADEDPITYLNKGQTYSLTIIDTVAIATGAVPAGAKYQTFVRISFDEDKQRQKPGECWSLWRAGRGTTEAHERNGKLQAVEYVEMVHSAETDKNKTKIELERFSVDGFCVTWTTGTGGVPEANIAVRFNFLSTDFSHSKGVRGTPVRLCAKTYPVTSKGAAKEANMETEICFCKVQLFRDHGAERKLSINIAHVRQCIDVLEQQLAQIESGMKDDNNRKRTSDASKALKGQRPGEKRRLKRKYSKSSAISARGFGGESGRLTIKEDIQITQQALKRMSTSTRPVSVLYLRGEDHDDPDRHPVTLTGDLYPPLTLKTSPRQDSFWRGRSAKPPVAESTVSQSPNSLSMVSQGSRDWQNIDAAVHGQTCDQLSSVSHTDEAETLSGWNYALGVDPPYRPPKPTNEAVACFYIQNSNSYNRGKMPYHWAIYLTKRTIEEFSTEIAIRWGIDPTKIERTIHLLHDGLEVEMDDDVIRELREGQDMRLEIEKVTQPPKAMKREREVSTDDSSTAKKPKSATSTKFVLRLVF